MSESSPEEKLLSFIKKAQGKLKLKKDLKVFKKVNAVLGVLMVIILAIFLRDIFIFDYDDAEEVEINFPEEEIVVLPVISNVNENIEEEKKIVVEKNVKEAKSINLTLLGIIRGENDQAIIEDENTKNTFFLYEGDSFGEFTLYDIKEGVAILDRKGEKIELNI